MKTKGSKAVLAALLFGSLTACTNSLSLPQEWQQEWDKPSAIYRPLQIVHGADLRGRASYYKDTCGLGGVVCNVPFGPEYLKSESDWKMFVDGTKEALAGGLR